RSSSVIAAILVISSRLCLTAAVANRVISSSIALVLPERLHFVPQPHDLAFRLEQQVADMRWSGRRVLLCFGVQSFDQISHCRCPPATRLPRSTKAASRQLFMSD